VCRKACARQRKIVAAAMLVAFELPGELVRADLKQCSWIKTVIV
jgi:hypothetical protein